MMPERLRQIRHIPRAFLRMINGRCRNNRILERSSLCWNPSAPSLLLTAVSSLPALSLQSKRKTRGRTFAPNKKAPDKSLSGAVQKFSPRVMDSRWPR